MVGAAYTLGDAARICGLSPRRLRYWQRTSLVGARATSDSKADFDFLDLVSVRSIVGLLEHGVPLQRIRRSVNAVLGQLPGLDPVKLLRWQEVSRRVVVRHQGVLMEPGGQLVLDLPSPTQGDVAQLVPRPPVPGSAEAREAALPWFEEGCRLDSDASRWAEALAAYRRAVELDPKFADAHCNLGSLHFNRERRDLALASFRRVLQIDPGHAEANLNLGSMLEGEGRDAQALRHYRAALERAPELADAHLSLALLCEKRSLPKAARSHWRNYLRLEPDGAWTEVARDRLKPH